MKVKKSLFIITIIFIGILLAVCYNNLNKKNSKIMFLSIPDDEKLLYGEYSPLIMITHSKLENEEERFEKILEEEAKKTLEIPESYYLVNYSCDSIFFECWIIDSLMSKTKRIVHIVNDLQWIQQQMESTKNSLIFWENINSSFYEAYSDVIDSYIKREKWEKKEILRLFYEMKKNIRGERKVSNDFFPLSPPSEDGVKDSLGRNFRAWLVLHRYIGREEFASFPMFINDIKGNLYFCYNYYYIVTPTRSDIIHSYNINSKEFQDFRKIMGIVTTHYKHNDMLHFKEYSDSVLLDEIINIFTIKNN